MKSEAVEDLSSVVDKKPEAAFESFFRALYPSVVRIAYSVTGDGHAAEDVAQDVFIAVRRRFGEIDDVAHAAAWARIAAVHGALNTLRGRRRRDLRQLRVGEETVVTGPEEILLERMSSQEVRDALNRLSPRAATVLVLRHSGLSYNEVARAMGVGVGQVGTMLRRAEVALRKEMEHATRQ